MVTTKTSCAGFDEVSAAVTFRLFLSHSTAEEDRPHLKRVVEAIESASGGRVRVLYDHDQIRGADEWRRRIAYLLHACNGAVVLLNERALRSSWVIAEATFLSIRATYDDGFRLVPVSTVPTSELDMRLGDPAWGPAALRDRQFVDGVDADAVAEAVLAGLKGDNGDLSTGESLMELLADEMASLMQHAPRGRLRRLADLLQGDQVPYDDIDDLYRAALVVARDLIASADLYESRKCIDMLGDDFVRHYGHRLLNLLTPLPVDVCAAATMRRRRADGGPAHVLLQSRKPTALVPLYVRRAYFPDRGPDVIALSLIDGTADDVRRALRVAARDRFWREQRPRVIDEEVDRRLQRTGLPLYASLPPVDVEVLREVSRDYPLVGFVFHHPQDEPREPVATVLRVIPPLDTAREELLEQARVDVLRGLRNPRGAP